MKSSAQVIRVSGPALMAQRTSVLRLLDVPIRAIVSDHVPRTPRGGWADDRAETGVESASASDQAPASGRQLILL
jgi:hypothetical protein